jgi:hypothetical protein
MLSAFVFPLFIPVIHLEGNQNPNHYQQDLPNGIQQVFAELVVYHESLTYLAEEAEHGFELSV